MQQCSTTTFKPVLKAGMQGTQHVCATWVRVVV
jgi:hypothetical protein